MGFGWDLRFFIVVAGVNTGPKYLHSCYVVFRAKPEVQPNLKQEYL